MSIFKAIGLFFVGLFASMKKAYEKLSEAEQSALQNGVGLIGIINNNLTSSPAAIRQAIQTAFPALDEPFLEDALFKVCKTFNLTTAANLDDAIKLIQGYLSALDGKPWAVASHAAASLLSVLFAPANTKVATITSLIEWVYQHFFKKSTDESK